MIIGTAGHIDHGKTSLIKALTGTDADRLPEEKLRGITVDLGFAYQHFDTAPSISFLDVPGHEKLIHNMLAGAIGMDFVVLVVAADDGVMPQTIEHLAVIDLIGIARGVIVITKIDRVSAARLIEVEAQIAALVSGTTLAHADILPVSSIIGTGIEVLAQTLAQAARAPQSRNAGGHFRLAVDRCFTLSGIGLVVTGTVYSGSVAIGDTLLHSPAGTEVRVRGVRAENREAQSAGVGQRCALNIVGRRIEKEHVARGDWMLTGEVHAPTARLDVQLRLLASEQRTLKHWTPVHVHIASAERTGRLVLLHNTPIAPGQTALAQLVLEAPLGGLTGDRFVIRDQSALRTMGGGVIFDPFPPQRGTRTPERLAILAAMDNQTPASALTALVSASANGIDLAHFKRARNLTSTEVDRLVAASSLYGASVHVVSSDASKTALAASSWDAIKADVIAYLTVYQQAHQDSPGATIHELLRLFKDARRRVLAREAVTALLETGALRRSGQLLHLPGHEIKLNDSDEALWLQIEEALQLAGLDQPRVTVLAATLDLEPSGLQPVLEKLGRVGRLRRVSKGYFMLPAVVDQLGAIAKASAQTHPQQLLTVGRLREETNISRHMVMPLLEYFDKIGHTRRIKDGRQIRGA